MVVEYGHVSKSRPNKFTSLGLSARMGGIHSKGNGPVDH